VLKRRLLPEIRQCALILLGLSFALSFALSSPAISDSTLQRVRERNFLICGTGQNEVGFALQTEVGWRGFYVDFCRTVAAAILQDEKAVRFRPLASASRFEAIAQNEVDILARSTAQSFSSDALAGITFVAPLFYDGVGFLIGKSSQITSALELSGAQVCVVSGSLAHISVNRFFQRREMKFVAVSSETWSGVVSQFMAESCAVMVADVARLAIQRSQLARPDRYTLLPEITSADTFGPIVSNRDWNWFKIVRWIVHALIRAEELGISKDNVRDITKNGSPAQKDFLKAAAVGAQALNLHPAWLENMLARVGNYGEIYNRNLGQDSGFNVPRGLNALVRDGGLMLAPAFR